MHITEFAKVAPYLTNPLVLVGFALFLCLLLFWSLLRTRLLVRLTQRQSAATIGKVLNYAAVLAGLVVIGGFASVAFRDQPKPASMSIGTIVQQGGAMNVAGVQGNVTTTQQPTPAQPGGRQ